MSTTSLFVELLVIGAGAAIWVGLLILAFFGIESLPAMAAKDLALPALLPALSVTYLLGILVDRLADSILGYLTKRLRAHPLGPFRSHESYVRARTLIYARHEGLRELYEYGRSRLRICRGWVVNAALMLIAFNLFLRSHPAMVRTTEHLQLVGNLAIVTLGIWAASAWLSLTDGEFARLAEQQKLLDELEKSAGGAARR